MSEAFAANPDSEDIWLAAVKLEKETKEPERARALLTKARERASTERVWMRSAQLEREFKNPELERELLEKATKLFPKSWKLNLMLAQLGEREGNIDKARLIFHHGLNISPNAIAVWLCAAQAEINQVSPPAGIVSSAHPCPASPHPLAASFVFPSQLRQEK